MPAFHQIGHDSDNLLWEPELERFAGAILSPLNYTPAETAEQIANLKKHGKFTLLDPHLYRPQSDRLQLPTWNYYPKDVETADLSSESWWAGLVDSVAKAKALHDLLHSLGRELYESLRSTADTLKLSDAPTAKEFSTLLREMPVFDLGQMTLTVRRPRVALLFGRSFAER